MVLYLQANRAKETCMSNQNYASVTASGTFYWLSFVCSVYNKPKFTFMYGSIRRSATANNIINLHARHTTAFQPNIFFIWVTSVTGHTHTHTRTRIHTPTYTHTHTHICKYIQRFYLPLRHHCQGQSCSHELATVTTPFVFFSLDSSSNLE
jgi:hypothetical protein